MCRYILTKALPLFTLLLKIAYVELKVGKWKHALVSHLLQNQTMDPWRWQITQADQDRAHMWKVDDGWRKWNTLFMKLSLLYLEDMRTNIFFHTWTFIGSSLSFLFSFFRYHMPLLMDTRERAIINHGVLFYGWNGIANFQGRSLSCSVYMILIKQVWKTSH